MAIVIGGHLVYSSLDARSSFVASRGQGYSQRKTGSVYNRASGSRCNVS